MGYYDDLCGTRIIERTLKYNGKTRPVYFRTLKAGERVMLNRGQRMNVGGGGENRAGMDIDAGDLLARAHKLLAYANVTEDGKQVFKNEKEVAELPEDLVSELSSLAQDALSQEVEEAAPGES